LVRFVCIQQFRFAGPMKVQLWAGVLFRIIYATRVAMMKEKDNFEGVDIKVTPWNSFDPSNPVLSSSPGTAAQARIFRIVEQPRPGKTPFIKVYDVGTSDARLPHMVLFYQHDSELLGLDALIKDSADRRLLEWRSFAKTSRHSVARTFITSPGKGRGNETYYTMTYLSNSKRKQRFTLDAGRCPKSKKLECGKRILDAQGGKKFTRIFSPRSDKAVADLTRLSRKRTALGKADTYEFTVLPGHDPVLLTNFACFVASAKHVEHRQNHADRAVQAAGGAKRTGATTARGVKRFAATGQKYVSGPLIHAAQAR